MGKGSKRIAEWVDWVELGCRGWSIDESGAEWDQGDNDYAHVDLVTGGLMLCASGLLLECIMADLRAACVVDPTWVVTTGTNSTAGTVTASIVPTTRLEGFAYRDRCNG